MERRIYTSDEWRDHHLALDLTPEARLELLSLRARISAERGARSHDYICVVADDERRLAFCVCDGVSGSFMGYFAAQFLARRLTPFLLERAAAEEPLTPLGVRAALREWTHDASIEAQALSLPAALNAIVRAALEERSATRGSETVFLAGSLSWVKPDQESATMLARITPEGEAGSEAEARFAEASGDLRIYAMGNVRGVITSADGARTPINAGGTDTARWGSLHGPTGAVYAGRFVFSDGRLRIGTDGIEGLEALEADAWGLSTALLMERALEARAITDTDDIAILDVCYSPSAPTPAPPRPA